MSFLEALVDGFLFFIGEDNSVAEDVGYVFKGRCFGLDVGRLMLALVLTFEMVMSEDIN